MKNVFSIAAIVALAGGASAALDGQNIAADAAAGGLALLATQDTPTAFGDSSGADQGAPFGSELNQLWATIDSGTLKLSITGNLEGNFNKFWVFFDAVDGGEANLAGDNADGGFGEINAMTGLGFSGATMDHGLRIEVGGGFYGVNGFDLIDNSAFSVASGGGIGDLPLSGLSGGGVSFGWDNSNGAGVDSSSAAGAATADLGWEFEIDLASFFGDASISEINITAFVSNGGGDFLSNQVLPGVGGGDNLGAPGSANLGFVTAVPTPGAAALLGVAGLAAARRRRA